jgi:superfamily I DNA and RNA helicase|uniref:Uncharacterized protein n=1 Tax=viral metagenome TaxID=1070528 RepID=A0A6C0AGH1_9ZZZZ|tara:strand:+ start:13997 stop:14200 length:204 start_codon:yes stop_codon:yes gene_type:complete
MNDQKDQITNFICFDNINQKVNYITQQNSKELEAILLKDDALSTMLIDMINNKKYGNDFQRTKLLNS